MPRKTKEMKTYKKSLNQWQAYIKSNYDKVRQFPNKERFKRLSQMYKIDNR